MALSVWGSPRHFVSLNESRFITDNQCQRESDGRSSHNRQNHCVYGHYVPYELVCLIEGLDLNDVCVHMQCHDEAKIY